MNTHSLNHHHDNTPTIQHFKSQEALFHDDQDEDIESIKSSNCHVLQITPDEVQAFAKSITKVLNSKIEPGNLTVSLNINLFMNAADQPNKNPSRPSRVIIVKPPPDSIAKEASTIDMTGSDTTSTTVSTVPNVIVHTGLPSQANPSGIESPKSKHRSEDLPLPPNSSLPSPSRWTPRTPQTPGTPGTPLPSIPEYLSPTTTAYTTPTVTTMSTPPTPYSPNTTIRELSTPFSTPPGPRNQRPEQAGQGKERGRGRGRARNRNRNRGRSNSAPPTGPSASQMTSFPTWYNEQQRNFLNGNGNTFRPMNGSRRGTFNGSTFNGNGGNDTISNQWGRNSNANPNVTNNGSPFGPFSPRPNGMNRSTSNDDTFNGSNGNTFNGNARGSNWRRNSTANITTTNSNNIALLSPTHPQTPQGEETVRQPWSGYLSRVTGEEEGGLLRGGALFRMPDEDLWKLT